MKAIRNPLVHMVAIGSLLFAASLFYPGMDAIEPARPSLEIPQHQVDAALKMFNAERGRVPNDTEYKALLDNLINQEILYRYALDIGIDQDPAAQRRLAQSASFVDENPHEAKSQEQLAATAMAMGLHHGDLIVRRILGDSARRLIRAVVLVHEPREDAVEAYLRNHPERFMQPARTSLAQITINALKHGDNSLSHASQLLESLQSDTPNIAEALAQGDNFFLPATLNSVTDQALRTQFGDPFASAIADAAVGTWVGPIRSRYGYHLVYIREREPGYVPPAEQIYTQVAQALRQALADEFLAERLMQLRETFEIILPEQPA